MKNSIKYLIIALLIIIALIIYWNKYLFLPSQGVSVDLKWKHQAQFAGMYVAKEKNFYKHSGLNVSFNEFNIGDNQIENLVNGISDFALVSSEEFLLALDSGYDVVALSSIYQISPYIIVSLSDSGIINPSDFLGKKLGIKGGKAEERIFYSVLAEKFGISEEQANITEVGFAKKEVDDLLDGDVDTIGLYRTDQLYFFDIENIDYQLIYPEKYGVNINNDIIITTRDYLNKNRTIVKNFIKATILGWEYTIDNPWKASNISMNYITDDNYKNRDYQMYILENSIPLIKTSSGQNIGYVNIFSFENLYKNMKENGFIKNQFNVKDFILNDFNE